ncbi:MAG TPA: sugar ABC transporter substrate-binding protein [Ignavibacteriaceae bacterium]|nr:sugar ABC transporter substrate-binding protein [Ignavibacteriaceae bacterium]
MKNLLRLLLSVLILIQFSCNSSGDQKVVNFWAMGAEGESIRKLIPEFEKEYPGIKINIQMIPWNAAQEKLITAYAGNNTPDACQLGNTWIPQFAALDAIENLDSFIERSRSVSKENFFEGIWETNRIGKSIYGIPWYVDTRVLFYRKDILKSAGYSSPPKTWSELYDASKKVKALYKKGEEKYAIFIPTNEWADFVIFALQLGAPILKNNNSYGDFSGRKFKEAFDYLIRFHKEKLSPIGITQVTNIYQALADSFVAMYISGPWHVPEFKKWMTGDIKDKWGTAPLPGPNDSIGLSLAGGSSCVIFKNSEKKKEVWKFIEFLSEPKIQAEFYHLVNDLPAVKSAWEDSSLQNDEYLKAFYVQLHRVIPTPKIPEWEQIVFSKLQNYIEIAARGTMTTDEALLALDNEVNQVLEKRRWLLGRSETP